MRVYPSILLRKGDVVQKPWGWDEKWTVVDMVEWKLILNDGTHNFSPPWGFYLKQNDGCFIPLVDNSPPQENNVSYFYFGNGTTYGF